MQEKAGRARGEWRWAAGMAAGAVVFMAMAYMAREAVRKPMAKPLHTPLAPKEEVSASTVSKPATKDAEDKEPRGRDAVRSAHPK